jgi:hypothetical protein
MPANQREEKCMPKKHGTANALFEHSGANHARRRIF